MVQAADWSDAFTVQDNTAARESGADDSAYVQDYSDAGVTAAPRGWRGSIPTGREPQAVWLIVVGSIAALFVLGKAFKTVRA